MDAVKALIDDRVTRGVVPSISLSVRVDGEEVLHHTAGWARLHPPVAAVEDQPYDLASVTKVLAGTAVIASLVEDGSLDLQARAAHWLPGVDERITVQHLLQHGSGLPAWRKYYQELDGRPYGTAATREHVYALVRGAVPEAEPGSRHSYSDIGFLWLLQIAERATETPFAQLFHQRVTLPSGVSDLRWGWPNAAATEWPCPYRGVGVQGTVHDLNCASIGGVSTHAGLFGTARAVAALADAFRSAVADPFGSDLPGRTLARFWATQGPGSHRCGWDSITRGGYTSTGRFFPDDAIGHLGYTGTSVWIVPSRRTVVALLTNRAHPIDALAPIRRLRPAVHDAVAQALGWDTQAP